MNGWSAADVVSLAVCIGLVALTSITGSRFMPGPWYRSLRKPAWTPPDWVFPVAWAFFYVLIAYAGWLMWQADGFGPAFAMWLVQLVLNAAWSYIMFGLRRIATAFADLVLLWLSIAAFIALASEPSPLAAQLFVPYLAWVTFAGALNLAVLRMNLASASTGPRTA